jgi:tripartite-type tricarboxylate transporter receptor subunit TctC
MMRRLGHLIGIACFVWQGAVLAQSGRPAERYPQKPVRILVGLSPGGNPDLFARMMAHKLGVAFGQQFVVENRVGGNGIIATEAVARAPADGHTLLWAITPLIAINPVMMKVPYDPVRDLLPISAVSHFSFGLVVNQHVPVRSVAQYVNYVRAQPQELAYAEGGLGSLTHLTMALFLHRAGLRMTNVSYRGTEPALTDVSAGHLPTMFAVLGDAVRSSANGNVRLLAVSGAQRSRTAPDVPTIAESGFPGFAVTSWHGLMTPAGTPQAVVSRIAAEVARATKDPQYQERLTNYGADPIGNSPEEFAAMMSADIRLWGEAVRIAGIPVK